MSGSGIAIEIDKIINSIERVSTGEIFQTDVEPVEWEEVKLIHKKDEWNFNWKRECRLPERRLYKLVIKGRSEIQGLLSLEIKKNEQLIEMHLIENARRNQGKEKIYAGVAASLVAFACKLSFDAGFDGLVVFTAKTKLVSHYEKTLGAQLIYGRQRMGIFSEAAKKLVNSCYENSKDN
jgi:hypothetical protein